MSQIYIENFDASTTGATPAGWTSTPGGIWLTRDGGLNGSAKALAAILAASDGYAYNTTPFTSSQKIVAKFRVKAPDTLTYQNLQVGLHVPTGTQTGSAPVNFGVGPTAFTVTDAAQGGKAVGPALVANQEYTVTLIARYDTGKFAVLIDGVLYKNDTAGQDNGTGYSFYSSATAGTAFGRIVLQRRTSTTGAASGGYSMFDEVEVRSIDATATTYTLSGPTAIAQGMGAKYTVALPQDTDLSSNVVITFSDGGAGGTFTPATVTLGAFRFTADTTYTPSSSGAKTLSAANDGGLTNPSSIVLNVAAPGGSVAFTDMAIPFWQRSGAVKGKGGSANLSLSGTYANGVPSSIEWRFKGGTWTALTGATISGGAWSGTALNVPAGQGTLEVRFANDTAVSSGYKDPISVGDIIIGAGQSNMSGRGTSNQSDPHPLFTAYLYGNDNVFKVLTDPWDSQTGQIDTVSRDGGASGSYIIHLANRIMNYTGAPVLMVPCPLGGSDISQWLPGAGAGLYANLIARAAHFNGVLAILWHQGESDSTTGKATYKTRMQTLAAALATALPGTFFIPCTLQRNTVTSGANDAVNEAIRELWGVGNIGTGAELSTLPADTDGLHLRTTSVLTAAADLWFLALLFGLYGAGASSGGTTTTVIRSINA